MARILQTVHSGMWVQGRDKAQVFLFVQCPHGYYVIFLNGVLQVFIPIWMLHSAQ